jgi:hypothetical protein
MTRPKFRWNLEIIIGIAATVTSACALIVSVMQARFSYQQQEAMVFPYLTCSYNTSLEKIEENISNDGLGPAFISKVEMQLGDTVYSNIDEPYRVFTDTLNLSYKPQFAKSDLVTGWVLKVGERRPMWAVQFPTPIDTAAAKKFYEVFDQKLGKLKQVIKIHYVDVYGNCYLFNSKTNLVERVANCPNQVLKR